MIQCPAIPKLCCCRCSVIACVSMYIHVYPCIFVYIHEYPINSLYFIAIIADIFESKYHDTIPWQSRLASSWGCLRPALMTTLLGHRDGTVKPLKTGDFKGPIYMDIDWYSVYSDVGSKCQFGNLILVVFGSQTHKISAMKQWAQVIEWDKIYSTVRYWTWASRNSEFSHETWWFFIVMLVYKRVRSNSGMIDS